jgi:hypothetical protein
MKNKFARIHGSNCIAAAITEQMLHDFNLKKQEMTNLKKKVSYAKMLEKPMYLRIQIYSDTSKHQQKIKFKIVWLSEVSLDISLQIPPKTGCFYMVTFLIILLPPPLWRIIGAKGKSTNS